MQMRVEINRLHRRLGATMIFVTHDQVEAMTLADRIVVLRKGVIEQVGTPLELYNKPANIFVAGFIGSPRMNLLPGRIGRVDGHRAEIDLDHGQTLTTDFPDPAEARRDRHRRRPPRASRPRRARRAASSRARCRSPSSSAARPTSTSPCPAASSVTVEIKGQAAINPGDDDGARLRRRQVPRLRPRREGDPPRLTFFG